MNILYTKLKYYGLITLQNWLAIAIIIVQILWLLKLMHDSQPCMAEMSAYTCNTLHSYSRGAWPPSVNIGGATGPSGPPFPTPLV